MYVLPKKGVIVNLDQLKLICVEYNMMDTWKTIELDPPKNPFKTDGCTMWPDNWKSHDIYPCCVKHDIRYWCGYPGDSVKRLIADFELGIDVVTVTKNVSLSLMMFQGVRAGGSDMFNQHFSWAFGRI